ncbi:MAG: hypothetical protein LBG80_10765 [Bacteroidales bacterium]|nr:hypothetical protein [Bacteroidales bacterium]
MEWLSRLPLYGWIFLTIIIFVALGVLVFLLLRGFKGKFGPLEIGGLREELDSKIKEAKEEEANIREDNDLGIELKKFMDEVDENLHADLIAKIEEIDKRVIEFFVGSECEFQGFRFISSIKKELYNRINYNDLKTRLKTSGRDAYIKRLKNDIRNEYDHIYRLTLNLKCGLKYPDFSIVEQQLFSTVDWVIAEFIRLLKSRLEEKIAKYKEIRPLFKTETRRIKHVDIQLKRNQDYLSALS